MMARPLTHQAAVIVFLLNAKGEIALMERTGTEAYVGDFCAPGGSIDPSEDPLTAAIREVREEVGVEIAPEDLEFTSVVDRPSRTIKEGRLVLFIFTCRQWQGEVMNAEPDKHADPQWYALDKLPAKLSPVEKVGLQYIGRPGLVVQ